MSFTHRADPLFVEQLLNMGFPQVRAEKALVKTHNVGVERALTWLVEHADDPDIDEPWAPGSSEPGPSLAGGVQWGIAADSAAAGGGSSGSGGGGGGPMTSGGLVIGLPSGAPVVVQPDGRQASATLDRWPYAAVECKVVLVVATSLGMSQGKTAAQCAHAALGLYRQLLATCAPWLHAWEEQGEKTVVLCAEDSAALAALDAQAVEYGLQSYVVVDAGRTEVAAGSSTVLAIGGAAEEVDRVTGQLRTLR